MVRYGELYLPDSKPLPVQPESIETAQQMFCQKAVDNESCKDNLYCLDCLFFVDNFAEFEEWYQEELNK